MIGFAPSDDIGGILQVAGVGTLIGTAVALRLASRDSDADRATVIARWTLALAGLAALVTVLQRLGWL